MSAQRDSSPNAPEDPGSPSDRFLSKRVTQATVPKPPQLANLPGPTSDLSQAIGNIQNETRNRHQSSGYLSSYPSQIYRSQSYPTQSFSAAEHQPTNYQTPSYRPPSDQYQSHQSQYETLTHPWQAPRRPVKTGGDLAQNHLGQSNQLSEPGSNIPLVGTISSKKNPKLWLPEADDRLIKLRAKKVPWPAIALEFPGRSAEACRLHYQNYVEKNAFWSEDQKDGFSRAYEKNKEDMWEEIAKEMGCSIDEAEAVHWQMGEEDMACRANVLSFSQMKKPPASQWQKSRGRHLAEKSQKDPEKDPGSR